MAEEAISTATEKLNNVEDLWDSQKYTKDIMKLVKNGLISILDLLVGRSPTKSLNYLIADVVEMAHDAQALAGEGIYHFRPQMAYIKRGLDKSKASLLHLRDEGSEVPLVSQNVGDVVGLEETVESLLREIILPNKDRESYNSKTLQSGPHTWCVWGVGGIGKTTLARQSYDHADVAARYCRRAWACFSGGKSNKQVLMELIVQVAEDDVERELLEEMDNESLQQMLHQRLLNKPYFIVLDDVDENTYLTSILKALPQDKTSRLLLTCQSGTTYPHCNYTHEMEYLDGEKSWQLFLKIVFSGSNSLDKFPKRLEKRGRKMLEQCSGLPLAIMEVGRQLAIKRQLGSEWEELLESPLDLTQSLAELEPSYHRLTPKEKSIFLCLAFFEEGSTVRVKKLLQIGIAQRVISEEEAERKLSLLCVNSFFDVNDRTKDSRLKSLRVKIIFHRLSVKIGKEEINFEILRGDGNNPSSEKKTSHRAIYCSREKFDYSKDQDKHLVSLFFRGGGCFDASPSSWENFERLMILDMEGFGLKFLPEEVGDLTRLRYLGLRNNHIQKLPLSLGCLRNLEVLDIALNLMVEMPDIIWKMKSLRHIYMSNIVCLSPLKIDALENLETLAFISVDNWTYELSSMQMMIGLRNLGIEELDGDSDVSKLFASLAELKNLYSLNLKGYRYKRMRSLDEIGILHGVTRLKLDGLLTRLPSAESFPPYMCYLTLVNSSLDEDPMPILEKCGLVYLKLQNAYTGRQMVISRDGFRELEYLHIKELWHLRNVRVGKLAMPNLVQFSINDCPYLESYSEVKSKHKGFEIVTNQKNIKKYKWK